MPDTDPDYDDDGSPKFATEAERLAAWKKANHAPGDEEMWAAFRQGPYRERMNALARLSRNPPEES